MAKNEKTTKVPKTIKQVTLLKAFIIAAAIGVSFGLGWFARTEDQSRVQQEASALVTTLKVSE